MPQKKNLEFEGDFGLRCVEILHLQSLYMSNVQMYVSINKS